MFLVWYSETLDNPWLLGSENVDILSNVTIIRKILTWRYIKNKRDVKIISLCQCSCGFMVRKQTSEKYSLRWVICYKYLDWLNHPARGTRGELLRYYVELTLIFFDKLVNILLYLCSSRWYKEFITWRFLWYRYLLFYECIQQIYHFRAFGEKVVNLLNTRVELSNIYSPNRYGRDRLVNRYWWIK